MSRFRPHLLIKKAQLDANDLRQCLRIAFGAVLGFTLSKIMNWQNGVFFVMSPILLLALVPTLNRHIVYQYIAQILLVTVLVGFVQPLLSPHPVAMTLTVLVVFAGLFTLMSRGPMFLFGAMGVVQLSITLHFASYNSIALSPMLSANIVAGALALVIAFLMHTLFPDVAPRPPRKRPDKPKSNQRHEVILASLVATASFVVFQCFDLRDSLSAQIATVLILFPLNWKGAGPAGWNRAIGTLVGCNFALVAQLLLQTHSHQLLLVTFCFWFGVLVFARYHMLEGGVSAAGFSAMSSLAVIFAQYLTPQQDVVFDALYRFSSLAFAVLLTLCLIYLLHRLLNRFSATRLI